MPEFKEEAGAASLTGQLLVRKGAARPSPSQDASWSARLTASGHIPAYAPPPSQSPSRLQADAPVPPVERKTGALHLAWPAQDAKRTVKLSLRLDPERHRRLRLAAVHTDQSLQALLVNALDGYLEGLDVDCSCIRGQAAPAGSTCADCPSTTQGARASQDGGRKP